jgi:hypothetical protein
MKRSRTKGALAVALLATLLPISTAGCFGQFALTRKVYRFNRELSNDRWVRWIGFLVMAIVPIYAAAGAVDLVFANSIEFWGGDNPFAASDRRARYAFGPHGELLAATPVEDGVIEFRVVDREGRSRAFRVVRESASVAAYDEVGDLVARVGDVDGVAGLLFRR